MMKHIFIFSVSIMNEKYCNLFFCNYEIWNVWINKYAIFKLPIILCLFSYIQQHLHLYFHFQLLFMQLFTFICSPFSVLSDFEKYRYICTATHKFKYCGEYSYTHTHAGRHSHSQDAFALSRKNRRERKRGGKRSNCKIRRRLTTHAHTQTLAWTCPSGGADWLTLGMYR